MSTAAPRIAYLMSRYPLLTETFILREMLELEHRGVAIEVFPLLRENPAVVHREIELLRAPVHYTPFISFPILAANLHYLIRCPRRYLSTLYKVMRGNWGSTNLFVGALGIFPKSAYFARLIERRGIDHVHAHYATHPALAAYIISALTGVGYSFTVHAHDIFIEQRMIAEKVTPARFVVAISQYNKDLLHRLVPSAANELIQVVHCGIDLARYQAPADRAGRPTDGLYALCVASLQPYKGIRYLIEACAIVAERVPGFRCDVLGEGVDRPQLEALIAKLSLGSVIRLVGPTPQDKVAALLREADLFVLPSIIAPSGQMEGIPVALMEAMASELPVVTTRISGIPELVEDGVNGFLVSARDVGALAESMIALAADREMRVRMGREGRAKVAREFELKETSGTLHRMFQGVISDEPLPRGLN